MFWHSLELLTLHWVYSGCYLFCFQPPYQVMLSYSCVIPSDPNVLAFLSASVLSPVSLTQSNSDRKRERKNLARLGWRLPTGLAIQAASQIVAQSSFLAVPALAWGIIQIQLCRGRQVSIQVVSKVKASIPWTYRYFWLPMAGNRSRISFPSRQSLCGSRAQHLNRLMVRDFRTASQHTFQEWWRYSKLFHPLTWSSLE
jgi:hypothetical protein